MRTHTMVSESVLWNEKKHSDSTGTASPGLSGMVALPASVTVAAQAPSLSRSPRHCHPTPSRSHSSCRSAGATGSALLLL